MSSKKQLKSKSLMKSSENELDSPQKFTQSSKDSSKIAIKVRFKQTSTRASKRSDPIQKHKSEVQMNNSTVKADSSTRRTKRSLSTLIRKNDEISILTQVEVDSFRERSLNVFEQWQKEMWKKIRKRREERARELSKNLDQAQQEWKDSEEGETYSEDFERGQIHEDSESETNRSRKNKEKNRVVESRKLAEFTKQKKKVEWNELFVKAKKKTEIYAAARLKSSKNENTEKILYEDEWIEVERIIKYLHFSARFIIRGDVTEDFKIETSSIQSSRFEINAELTRSYADIIKNSALNKIWEKSQQWRELAEQSCWIQLLNKKFKIKNWTTANLIKSMKMKYHVTDSHESRISEDHVWWVKEMKDEEFRDWAAIEIVFMHRNWKIQVHIRYKQECKKYFRTRVQWKYAMIREILRTLSVEWSLNLSKKEILKRVNSRNISIVKDYQELIEQKRTLKTRDRSQSSDKTENDDDEED